MYYTDIGDVIFLTLLATLNDRNVARQSVDELYEDYEACKHNA